MPDAGVNHVVQAVNLEDELLLVVMDGTPGLARIDHYTDGAGHRINSFEPLTGRECWAWYKIGDQEFSIPLGSNMGDSLNAEVKPQ
jgi:hypothetical protein